MSRKNEPLQDQKVVIREFHEADADDVRKLFIRVNQLLAPDNLKDSFASYIASSLTQEIDRISDYYLEKNGGFWVALIDDKTVGMFGLEPSGDNTMELRRMYVDPDFRRRGIAAKMLQYAEDTCRQDNVAQLDLSTSEVQGDALAFYRQAGYSLVHEEVAETVSNKTIGGGIRRYHFKKKFD